MINDNGDDDVADDNDNGDADDDDADADNNNSDADNGDGDADNDDDTDDGGADDDDGGLYHNHNNALQWRPVTPPHFHRLDAPKDSTNPDPFIQNYTHLHKCTKYLQITKNIWNI